MRAKDFDRKHLKNAMSIYINTAMSYAGCARELYISTGMFQKLIERAIVERVATDAEVQAICNKAANNCYNYGGEGGAHIAEEKYARLRAKRLTYEFTDLEKARYTTWYAMSQDADLKQFCKKECIPMDMMVDAIKCSIKDSLIGEDVLNWLIENLVVDVTADEVIVVLEHLLDIRESNKKDELTKDETRPSESKKKESQMEQLSFFTDDITSPPQLKK